MEIIISPSDYAGTVTAPVSKSHVHRLLICAALCHGDNEITINLVTGSELSNDIKATVECLTALGAAISVKDDQITVIPMKKTAIYVKTADLMCGESGSTLRFMLPVTAAFGIDASFHMEGRLPMRPLSPLYEELENHGCTLSYINKRQGPLHLSGKLIGGERFTIPGNVSSQYISGLLLALPLMENGGEIEITGARESQSYIDMTLDAMRTFGIKIDETAVGYRINGGQQYSAARIENKTITAEGDWSNAAFWLTLGAISTNAENGITCENLNMNSIQGDKEIANILRKFGADVTIDNRRITVRQCPLIAPETPISLAEIPDLGPIVSVAAAISEGETHLIDAGRLRIKESDRLSAISNMIRRLGGDITKTENALIIRGKPTLSNAAAVNGCNDHRIVMAAAIASAVCKNDVTITDSEAVKKSYPSFFDEFERLKRRKGE